MKQTYTDKFGIETQPFFPTNVKLVKSGSVLELRKFGRDIFIGGKPRGKIKVDGTSPTPKPKNDPEKIRKASARRAKKTIKRLINANAFKWLKPNGKHYKPITLTLTFAEEIQDIKIANYEFTKFIRRLNYEANKIEGRDVRDSNLKYLCVPELQRKREEKYGVAVWHYHMIFFNLPYINNIYDRMREIWDMGRIQVGGKKKKLMKIKKQAKLNKVIAYFSKYIQKEIMENRLRNKQSYMTSRNLLKPITNYSPEVIYLIQKYLNPGLLSYHFDGEEEVNNGAKSIPYINWLKYFEYDLSSNAKLDEKIDGILADYPFSACDLKKTKREMIDNGFDVSQSKKVDFDEFFFPKTQPSLPNF